jgi:hypothetical protein
MIADYLLKFPSQSIAEQFGIANGFAAPDENGEVRSTLASHTHAMHVVGEHWIAQPDIDGEPQPAIGDGQWWVLFRDLVGIPIPDGGEQFIFWSSASDEPRPISDDVPSVWWA